MHDTAVLTSCRERASVRRGDGGQQRGRRREGHQTRTSSGPELQKDGTEKARPRLHHRRPRSPGSGQRRRGGGSGARGNPERPRRPRLRPAVRSAGASVRGKVFPGERVPQGAPQGPGLQAARGGNRDPGRTGIFGENFPGRRNSVRFGLGSHQPHYREPILQDPVRPPPGPAASRPRAAPLGTSYCIGFRPHGPLGLLGPKPGPELPAQR